MELEMEFRLHIVIYTLEGEDRFKVMAGTPESEEQVDVTAYYEVTAIQTEDGRAGFAVLPKNQQRSFIVSKDGTKGEFIPGRTGQIIPPPPEGPPNRLIHESEGG